MIGLGIILLLAVAGIYAVINIPYQEAVRLWRGSEDIWYQNPKNAAPAWFNYFTAKDLPSTILITSRREESTILPKLQAEKIYKPRENGQDITITYAFEYPYDEFPKDLIFYLYSKFDQKAPFAAIRWYTPDGREIRITDTAVQTRLTYRFLQDEKLKRRLKGISPEVGLLADPKADPPAPLKGAYKIVIEATTFEPNSDLDGEFVLHGQLHGWAGTDHLRRDLSVPLLWGIPVALAFGLLASLGTGTLTMIIAATGVWFSKWVDELIQRITEVNLVLPFLPILIMIGTLYSRSIWVILGATVLLNIFTGSIKSYRAIFLQVKESGYIEAARAYGASDRRIILLYLVPRIIPLLIPGLVSGIPSFVFLEASLAVLGLGDPVLPTWGKIINDAWSNGALYEGHYYWILQPAVLLMITGLAFASFGFSLDRIFNPRLRGV
ncbi:MAG: ABC transporter permease [Thermoflexales bacterium]|nr:ABC transporter permease [Thermoflexales bacterium]